MLLAWKCVVALVAGMSMTERFAEQTNLVGSTATAFSLCTKKNEKCWTSIAKTRLITYP